MATTNAQLEKVKLIDTTTKDCVNGYIRQIQDVFSNDESDLIIAPLVIYWITLYYHIWEEFDPNFCHSTYQISGNNRIIKKLETGVTNAYLTAVVNDGIHRWKFKLVQESTYMIVIGVFKNKYTKFTKEHDKLYDRYARGKYYGWSCTWQETTSGDTGKTRAYGERECKTGDIVEMILDLDDLKLRYSLNGKSQGVAFENIEKCEYVVGVYLYYEEDCIELLSYKVGGYHCMS